MISSGGKTGSAAGVTATTGGVETAAIAGSCCGCASGCTGCGGGAGLGGDVPGLAGSGWCNGGVDVDGRGVLVASTTVGFAGTAGGGAAAAAALARACAIRSAVFARCFFRISILASSCFTFFTKSLTSPGLMNRNEMVGVRRAGEAAYWEVSEDVLEWML